MSEANKYSLDGRVKVVMDAQTFGSGFEKREFVVTSSDGKYPQDICLECVQGKVSLLDDVRAGDEVKAHFDIRGKEYNGRYFNNLSCWKIETVSKRSSESSEQAPASAPASEPPDAPTEYEDDVPF